MTTIVERQPMSIRRFLAVGTVLVAVIVLLRLAAGVLDGPSLRGLASVGEWADDRGPAHVTFAVLRTAAEVATWYLLGLVALHLVAATLRVRGATAVADRLTTPAIARIFRIGLGVGLVVGHAAGHAATAGQPNTDVVAASPDEHAGTLMAVPSSPQRAGTATIRPTPDVGAPQEPGRSPNPSTASIRPLHDAPTPVDTESRGATVRPVAAVTSHKVTPGESFWSIAADVLEQRTGAEPTNDQIDPVWRALVERNRDRLVDPDDPDLIHPGQVLEVPA